MRTRISILLLFCSLGGRSIAQQYNFKGFSLEQGLSRSGVYCLLEDSRRYLWTGTEGGGLSRFDGQRFKTFTIEDGLPGNTVRALAEDRDGNIWIGTDGHGLSRYDGRTFTNYSTADGLSNDYVRCIAQSPDGDIWIGTFGGGINRLRFDNDSLKVSVFDADGLLRDNNVRAALTDADGTLWFGTDDGLCSYQNGKWTWLDQDDGLPDQRILTIYQDELKDLWIGTPMGVSRKTDAGFVTFTDKDGIINNRVRAICRDNEGNMWFGTKKGVTVFDGHHFRTYTEKNGLSNNGIRAIAKDRTGNMWLGTYFGGICRFSGIEFIKFSEKDGLTNSQVLSVLSNADSSVWVGTLDGITRMSRSANSTWSAVKNPLGNQYGGIAINTMFAALDGSVWIGTENGILIYRNGKTVRFRPDGQDFTEDVKALLFETDGSFWVGSSEGATRYKHTDSAFVFDQYHSHSNINESEVSCFARDQYDRIWIGYLNSEPVVFENGEFVSSGFPQTLRNVSAMAAGPNGLLWIATEGNGLFSFPLDADSLSADLFRHLESDRYHIPSDLHQLLFDKGGNLWAASTDAVHRITLNSVGDIVGIRHFGREDGFFGSETNENAICQDLSGNLWFGTVQGAVRLDPKLIPNDIAEAGIQITGVRAGLVHAAGNEPSDSSTTQGFYHLPVRLKVPYSSNNITFNFDGMDLRSPSKVRYQWKLEGFSPEWSAENTERSVTLTNLPAGEYAFNVRVKNGIGKWNSLPARFSFVITAPFWQTWWFKLLAFIAAVGLAWSVIKLREKQLLAEKALLQSQVDDRTKELRSEKERSDDLLKNILPVKTAEELKTNGFASVRQYGMVSVLFTDFIGFTKLTEGISHNELVKNLDDHFRMFDEVMDKYRIEKIKTIGDAYMAAGGIPEADSTNPLRVVMAGLEMVRLLTELNVKKHLKGETGWSLRLGIHTGSVISGVVGKNKFAFDIWGDAVNTASRMESSGERMRVNISGATYLLVKEHFRCTPRGKISAKNKGEIEMYFVDRLMPAYSGSEDGLIPNKEFLNIIFMDEKEIAVAD